MLPRKSMSVWSLICRLAPPELGPGEQGQAEADGGGYEGIDDGIKVYGEGVVDIKIASLLHEEFGETFKDTHHGIHWRRATWAAGRYRGCPDGKDGAG